MKLEQQVVSLELAKKLKSLGVKQESLFYWIGPCQTHGMIEWAIREKEKADSWNQNVVYSAFTVAELGEMLPETVFVNGGNWDWWSRKQDDKWECQYRYNGGDNMRVADTEADARALCLIYLLEHNLIKANDI